MKSPPRVPPTKVHGASPSSYPFLSPEWIGEVVRVVEAAKRADPYFRSLVGSFGFRVAYVIRNPPAWLSSYYENASQAVVTVRLSRGQVSETAFGAQLPAEKPDLVVTLDYDVAEGLFCGRLSPGVTIINRRIKAEVSNGFRHWPKISAHAIVTANRVLKSARQVPTAFASA